MAQQPKESYMHPSLILALNHPTSLGFGKQGSKDGKDGKDGKDDTCLWPMPDNQDQWL